MDSRTFRRRGETVTLSREQTADGVVLVATESGRRRTFPFTHIGQLVRFQSDMEGFLQRTGWLLAEAPTTGVVPAEPPAAAAAVTVRASASRLRLTLDEEEEVAARE